jgi:GMP synthase PP-ATPase subunit
VNSLVCAIMMHEAIGNNAQIVYIDNGMGRTDV